MWCRCDRNPGSIGACDIMNSRAIPKRSSDQDLLKSINSVLDNELEERIEKANRSAESVRIWRRLSQQNVIAAIQRGNPLPLIDLLESDVPLSSALRSWLADHHRPKPRGRPKQLPADRMTNSNVHAAARDVPRIVELLRERSPRQSKGYVGKATELSALRWGIKIETLVKYLQKRTKKSGRRIY
jgi:hypothetical protein